MRPNTSFVESAAFDNAFDLLEDYNDNDNESIEDIDAREDDNIDNDVQEQQGFYPDPIARAIASDMYREQVDKELNSPIEPLSDEEMAEINASVEALVVVRTNPPAHVVPVNVANNSAQEPAQQRAVAPLVEYSSISHSPRELAESHKPGKHRQATLNTKGKEQGVKVVKPKRVKTPEPSRLPSEPIVVRPVIVSQVEIDDSDTESEEDFPILVATKPLAKFAPISKPVPTPVAKIETPKSTRKVKFVPLNLSPVPAPKVPVVVAIPAVPIPETKSATPDEWTTVNRKKPDKPKPAVQIQDRNKGYELLANPENFQKSLAKTRMCNSVGTNVPCRHGNRCRFAHTKDELVLSACAFGSSCRYVQRAQPGVFVNKIGQHTGRICHFIHDGETKDSYVKRMEIAAPATPRSEPVRLNIAKAPIKPATVTPWIKSATH